MEATDKSGKIKLVMELEINHAAMELLKENMSNMMDMASQMGWRPVKAGTVNRVKVNMQWA